MATNILTFLVYGMMCTLCLSASIGADGKLKKEPELIGAEESDKELNVDDYLRTYGYLPLFEELVQGDGVGSPAPKGGGNRRDAIRKFQKFNGLKATGEINFETINLMKKPRCGLPDNTGQGADPKAPQSFNAQSKWDKKHLLWKLTRPTGQMEEGIQKLAIRNALNHWSDVAPLQFTETNQQLPDMNIRFEYGKRHGDGESGFGGRGGVLAHAFYPQSGFLSGDTHFDDAERWVYHSNGGSAELETVATHEFGHALGLGHSSDPNALMAPYYTGYSEGKPMLKDDDVRGIQSLYGAPLVTPKPTTPKPTSTTTTDKMSNTTTSDTPTDVPVLCSAPSFDALSQGPDGATYVFVKEFVFKINAQGLVPGYPKFTREVYTGFPEAPRHLKAAVYNRATGETFFFNHHGKVWRYKGFRLVTYSSISNSDFNAIVSMTDHVGKQRFFSFGENNLFREFVPFYSGMTTWTAQTNRYFRGIPSDMTSAIEWLDGNMYFFTKDKRYVSLDTKTRSPSTQKLSRGASLWLDTLCASPNEQNP